MSRKGKSWNESQVVEDPITLRKKIRITSHGQYNTTPTYHTGDAFTSLGDLLIFSTGRQGRSALCKAHTTNGDITCLIDPIDGTGSPRELHEGDLERGSVGSGDGIDLFIEVLPDSRQAVFAAGSKIRSVHLDSLEEQDLFQFDNNLVFSGSSATPDEDTIYFTLAHAHPEIVSGGWATVSLAEACRRAEIDTEFKIFRMPVAGGEPVVVYAEPGLGTGHVQCSPVDPDLLLINRDQGDNAVTDRNASRTRSWLLRVSTGELTELSPNDENRFQIHATWSWDGQSVVYHGPSARGGWYIGAIGIDGTVIREYCFPGAAYYGHVSAMVDRPAVIIDGNLTDNTLFWLYYDQADPRLEVIGTHDTNWTGMPWQYPHPHAHCSPDGRFISYNAVSKAWSSRGRSDVWLIEV